MRIFSIALFAWFAGCGGGGGGGTDAGDGGGGDAPDTADPVMFDEAYDETCDEPSCPAGQIETACSCVPAPQGLETNRTKCDEFMNTEDRDYDPEDDFCYPTGDENPDYDCFEPDHYNEVGESQMVTLYGVVDVFGNGTDAADITVAVYLEGEDGELGELVGMDVSDIDDACAEIEVEIAHDVPAGERELGFYAIENVPTETPLILKTSGNAEFWRDLYTYNFQLLNEEVETGEPDSGACSTTPTENRVRYRARTLSSGDYNSIPLTAGLTSGIPSGHGAVAGEIHDCSDVRIEYAQVGVYPPPALVTYFSKNPDNPLPDQSRTEGTSVLGLYAAIDVEPGVVDVAAIGQLNNQTVSYGWYRARAFAGSVTVVTLRGLRGHQVQ